MVRITLVLMLFLLAVVGLAACSSCGLGSKCEADFDYEIGEWSEDLGGMMVKFVDKSRGDVTSWKWDLTGGNKIESTKQNPSHLYTKNGLQFVTLTITTTDCEGTQSKTKRMKITGCLE